MFGRRKIEIFGLYFKFEVVRKGAKMLWIRFPLVILKLVFILRSFSLNEDKKDVPIRLTCSI